MAVGFLFVTWTDGFCCTAVVHLPAITQDLSALVGRGEAKGWFIIALYCPTVLLMHQCCFTWFIHSPVKLGWFI